MDIASIDFIRGVAALYVLVNHTRGAFFTGGGNVLANAGAAGVTVLDKVFLALLQLTSIGEEFVIVFFVVSGFAMAHSLSRSPRVAEFLKKRLVRVWPPYLAAILLAAVVSAAIAAIDPGNPLAVFFREHYLSVEWLALHATYLQVRSPLTPQFWSLPYEVIFYALCPLLLIRRDRVLPMFLLSVALFVAGMLAFGIGLNPSDSLVLNFFTNGFFYFMCGAVIYHFAYLIPKLPIRVFFTVLTAGLLAAICARFMVGYSSAGVNLLMVGLTALAIGNLPDYRLNFRFNVGFMSYSIYLFHYQLIVAIKFVLSYFFGIDQAAMTNYFIWVLAIPPMLLVCFLLYWIFERPVNAYLARLRASETAKRVPLTA